MTMIICGFPGVGKTRSVEYFGKDKVLDLDSSEFSHMYYFPHNYVDVIEYHAKKGTHDYILVSVHDVVRQELTRRGLKYVLVYPFPEDKDLYLTRLTNRGSPASLVELVSKNWGNWLYSLDREAVAKYKLLPTGYLSNVIEMLEKRKG